MCEFCSADGRRCSVCGGRRPSRWKAVLFWPALALACLIAGAVVAAVLSAAFPR